MFDFQTVFQTMESNGFVEYALPFFFVFAVMYLAISSKLFGEKYLPKNLRITISLAVSFLIIAQHYLMPYSQYDIVPVLFMYLPDLTLLLLAVLFILMGMGFIGQQKVPHKYAVYFTYFAIAFVIYLMLAYTKVLPMFDAVSDDTLSALIALILFFIIVTFITGGEENEINEKSSKTP